MDIEVFIEKVLFVIVLYKKKPGESAAFRSVQKISDTVESVSLFVYDNSDEPAGIKTDASNYRHDPENNGVSKAYNEASVLAAAKNKTWLLLLDQDMAFDSSFPEQLFLTAIQYPQSSVFVPVLKDRKGIISPFRWSFGKGKRISSFDDKLLLAQFRFANSGLLIKRETFELAGGYIESIPLDFSDIAFGEKLKKVTDHFVVVNHFVNHCFSGTEYLSRDQAIDRFNYFVAGAFEMITIFRCFKILTSVFSRTIRLTIKYRSNIFIKRVYMHQKRFLMNSQNLFP